jgi:hypothetical protein
VQYVSTSAVVLGPLESAPLRPRAPQIVLTSVPAARAGAVPAAARDAEVTPDASDDHGPVTGAFVTVGKEVGHGFRSAGRAIKSIF